MVNIALVTGAYGFIGRHVARALAGQGWHVIGIGHGTWSRDEWQRWGISVWHSSDVTYESLVTYGREPTLIVHCAGSGSVAFSLRHPYQDYHRTVATTLSVLEFARSHAPQARTVHISSAAVYGAVGKDGQPIREDSLLQPLSPYGVHKKLAEELCQSYSKHYGLALVILRLFSAYGVELRKQLLWDACMKIRNGDSTFFGTGSEVRDWLHVEDVADLVLIAHQKASSHCPIVNGGTGRGVSVKEVLAEVCSGFDRRVSPVFSGSPRSGDPQFYTADIMLAQSWGWEPQVFWREGVRAYVHWFLKDIP